MQDKPTNEVYWAAGFIEGEGTFSTARHCLKIAAGQKFREPLERLQATLGGSITKQKRRDFYVWQLHKRADVEATIDLLRPLLSKRRCDQIDAAIAKRDSYHGSAEHRKVLARLSARDRERYATDPDYRERRKKAVRKYQTRGG